MDLKGKKLLILGGNSLSGDIVRTAQKLGVYTIVTDWYDTNRSPAKLLADEYWNEEIFKPERIADLIKQHHIDGVMTGFTDSYLLQYQKICDLAGLPCYATKEVFELTMDKSRFKQLCRDYDVPVIPEYRLTDFDPKTISPSTKVIVKPVDNSGSRGVVLCQRSEDFEECVQYALSFSEKKQVIVEKYMELDSISVSYTLQDGRCSLSTIDDRYVHKSTNGSAVTCLGVYPSKYTDVYLRDLDLKVRTMFEKAGLRNGVLAMQFFTDGEEFYVMEMGHRLTGGQHYTYTLKENGISALEFLIHFALTGRMADYEISEHENPRFKNTYAHLFILGREAKIARMEGYDLLEQMPEAMHVQLMKNVGDTIGRDGTSAQKIAGLHLRLRDTEHLKRVMQDVIESFHVFDSEGNELTLDLRSEINLW